MSSPNLDALSVRLSHVINDPVTAATTDGQLITSSYRTQFLNDGIRSCLNKWVINENWMALRNYIKDGTVSLTGGQSLLTAWTGNVSVILSAKNSTDNVFVHPVPQWLKHAFDVALNQYLSPSATNQFYSIENGYFTLLDGTGTSTDAIYLRYVKEHSDLSVGAGASTVVYDAAFTVSPSGTGLIVTDFTGVIATHVGGTLTGKDNSGNPFSRLITSYISSTSFTIDASLTDNGNCTLGYITPPSQNDIEIDSQYWDEVLQEAYKIYLKRYPTDKNLARLQVASKY
jgi:hypothetical protein